MTETGAPGPIPAMASPRVRSLLSLGLLGCATMALVPLGCGATIRYPVQQDDRPRVSDATAERLRECVDEFGGDLPRGSFTFDATVKVDEEGHVVDVKSKGVPHEELAICMRIALRNMTVPEELVGLRERRLSAAPAPANGQAADERGLVGNAGLLVAVFVVLAEVVIEVGPSIVAIAAAVEISGEIAEVARKEDDEKPKTCSDHLGACLEKHRRNGPGEHWRASLCHACWKKCSNNEWPDDVPLFGRGRVSCKYD